MKLPSALEQYPQEAVDEVVRYKCFESILFQTRYFFRFQYNKRYERDYHYKAIAEVLERVYKGELTRVIINLPPRYGKTEIAVKHFIAKGLALNPAAKFIHVSYSDELALDNSESVRDLVRSDEFQRIFPHVQVKKDSNAKKKWYTTQGGGVYATSSGGQITGFGAGEPEASKDEDDDEERSIAEFTPAEEPEGLTDLDKFKFAGAIVIDDANKADDAESKLKRDRVNDRYDNTISSRVNSRKTPIIIVQQRIHANDLTGYLLAKESAKDWFVLRLPAIMEETDESGAIVHKALCPRIHTLEELRAKEKDNPVIFARQYQQKDEATQGLLLPVGELQFYNPAEFDPTKQKEFAFGYVDPSDTGGDDLSAPFTVLVGKKIYVHDVIYNTNGTDVNGKRIAEKVQAQKLNGLWVEGNGGWKLFGKDLQKKIMFELKMPECEVRIISNTKNKHARILEAAGYIKTHFVFRSDWRELPEYKKFMEVLTQYQIIMESSNPKDDAPDSCAGIARFYRTRRFID